MVRYHHWTPKTIDGLFLDGMDHFGLLYWEQDVQDVVAEMKAAGQQDGDK